MLDKMKQIFFQYKYQFGGLVTLVIVSLLYKYYFPQKENKENPKDNPKESQLKTDEIQREIRNEIKSLQKKLLRTEKQLLKYKDELNNKKELSLWKLAEVKITIKKLRCRELFLKMYLKIKTKCKI